MFIIDREKKTVLRVDSPTFADLKLYEREDLQEWIVNNPDMLCEDLLIIRKEDDEWDKTSKRLDLLAIDKKGNLVVIENKRDYAGRGVTWQALEYASFCSTLTKEQIVSDFQKYLDSLKSDEVAEDKLRDFLERDDFYNVLNEGDQRIILVAGEFPPEVTSTVMWLWKKHKVRIKCVQVTLYKHGENIFLDTEQIIPTKAEDDFMVKRKEIMLKDKETKRLVSESQRQEGKIYAKFWSELLQRMNEKSTLFESAKHLRWNWILSRSPHRAIWYELNFRQSQARVELVIERDRTSSKKIFDALHHRQGEIESKFGKELLWERRDTVKRSIIAYPLHNVSISSETDWEKTIEFFVEHVPRFEAAIRDVLNEVLADEPETASPEE